jgi:formate hydrogenlyase subunit 3/multisubunit Na+/H+ antiporter MnhD subunit
VPGGLWTIAIDPLSAWFLLILCCVGAPATIYGASFLGVERGRRPVAVAHALLALLLAAMIVALAARAVVLFMLAWETMALSAFLLIMFEGEQREVRRAGLLYLVMTHLGALALLGMFLVWGGTGPDLTFHSLALAAPGLPWGGAVILLLALIGFGGKAGVVPFHVWVPGADAAEPSHVSAVLSGVMLNMGIYGLLRVLSLIGPPPVWFGWTLTGLGLMSGILGVLWALGERDLKRVLAYSSVENLGIILLGMGVGVLGLAYGHPAVALLGFTGALLHALNHALFKSLLFLGAGAVLRATGTRVLDELGGLGRQLPWTALAFGLGAVAIVGLPPLNGFVSEWVAVQGLLLGAQQTGPLALLVLGVAGVGLIGALALACFSRAVGSVFLGQPRRPRPAVRDDRSLVGPMLVLAGFCVIAGLVPALAVDPAMAVVGPTLITGGLAQAEVVSAISGTALMVSGVWALLLAVGALAWLLRRRATRVRTPFAAPTWGCAYANPAPRMQYTAGSFATPLLMVFGRIAAPKVERTATSLRTRSGDRVLTGLIRPLWRRTRVVAAAFRPLQQGPVTRYLQYVVVTVLLLLAALFASIRMP